MKKSQVMQLALLAVVSLVEKYENMGVKIDTQEADFKAMSQQVEEALSMPDDVEPVQESTEIPAITPELLKAGFESVIASMPKQVEPQEKIDQVKLVQDLKIAVLDAMHEMVATVEAAKQQAAPEVPAVAG